MAYRFPTEGFLLTTQEAGCGLTYTGPLVNVTLPTTTATTTTTTTTGMMLFANRRAQPHYHISTYHDRIVVLLLPFTILNFWRTSKSVRQVGLAIGLNMTGDLPNLLLVPKGPLHCIF